MKRQAKHAPSGQLKGQLICPECGHTSGAVDGDWIDMSPGRRFRCPACGALFGDTTPLKALA